MAGYDPTVPEEMESVHETVLDAETVPAKEEAEVLGDTPTEETPNKPAPAPEKKPEPVKYAPKIPKGKEELTKFYSEEILPKARQHGLKASDIMKSIGEEMPIKAAVLPKLIPAIVDAINAKPKEAVQ